MPPKCKSFLFFVIVWHLFFALYEKWASPQKNGANRRLTTCCAVLLLLFLSACILGFI